MLRDGPIENKITEDLRTTGAAVLDHCFIVTKAGAPLRFPKVPAFRIAVPAEHPIAAIRHAISRRRRVCI